MRFNEDSAARPAHLVHKKFSTKGDEVGCGAHVYKVDFNRGLVTIMRGTVMETGTHYLAKLELIIMFHGALRKFRCTARMSVKGVCDERKKKTSLKKRTFHVRTCDILKINMFQ